MVIEVCIKHFVCMDGLLQGHAYGAGVRRGIVCAESRQPTALLMSQSVRGTLVDRRTDPRLFTSEC